MEQYYKVKDHEGLVKDPRTGAILLSDRKQADEYLSKKKALQNDRQIIEDLESVKGRLGEIDEVKSELSEIKQLLQALVAR